MDCSWLLCSSFAGGSKETVHHYLLTPMPMKSQVPFLNQTVGVNHSVKNVSSPNCHLFSHLAESTHWLNLQLSQ